MTFQLVISILGIVAAGISAFCWFWSAIIPPSYPAAYLSGPPKEITDRMDLQARLNAVGAAAAGCTVLFQGLLIAGPIFEGALL